MDPRDNPVDVAEIEACDEKAQKCFQSATTGPDGSYQLAGLPSGQYYVMSKYRPAGSTRLRSATCTLMGLW
jgi:hypothetical protein